MSVVPFPVATKAPCRTGLVSDLLVRCGAGDEAAFADLFDLFSPLMLAAICPGLALEQRDAAVRDEFVALWSAAPDYRPGRNSAIQWVMAFAGVRRPRMVRRTASWRTPSE